MNDLVELVNKTNARLLYKSLVDNLNQKERKTALTVAESL